MTSLHIQRHDIDPNVRLHCSCSLGSTLTLDPLSWLRIHQNIYAIGGKLVTASLVIGGRTWGGGGGGATAQFVSDMHCHCTGIGKATVERLASEGASVACFDINREAGERVAAEFCA